MAKAEKTDATEAPKVRRKKGEPGEDGKMQIALRITPEQRDMLDTIGILTGNRDRASNVIELMTYFAVNDDRCTAFLDQWGIEAVEE